jgi:hypothetical protein
MLGVKKLLTKQKHLPILLLSCKNAVAPRTGEAKVVEQNGV